MDLSANREKYLKDTLRSMLGLPKNKENLLPLPPPFLVDLFLREEERGSSSKDQWGNWEHPYADNYRRGKLWVPELDDWLLEVKKDLVDRGIELLPAWPDKAPFAVCLTHDVDLLSKTLSPRQWMRKLRQHWGSEDQTQLFTKCRRTLGLLKQTISLYPCIDQTIGALSKIERKMGVASTYFLFGSPLHRISQHDCVYSLDEEVEFDCKITPLKEVFNSIQREGCEIGLHGSYCTANVPGLLTKQKEQLESVLNRPITCTRQHFLHWDPKITPRLQEDAGIYVDGTLGYNRNIGFRSGTSYPHYFFDVETDSMLPLLEIPLIVQDGALMGRNALELDPEEAFIVTKHLIDSVKEVGGCFSLLLHPDFMLIEGVPVYYRKVIAYCRGEGAWFATFSALSEWWKQRNETLEKHHENHHHRRFVQA